MPFFPLKKHSVIDPISNEHKAINEMLIYIVMKAHWLPLADKHLTT